MFGHLLASMWIFVLSVIVSGLIVILGWAFAFQINPILAGSFVLFSTESGAVACRAVMFFVAAFFTFAAFVQLCTDAINKDIDDIIDDGIGRRDGRNDRNGKDGDRK